MIEEVGLMVVDVVEFVLNTLAALVVCGWLEVREVGVVNGLLVGTCLDCAGLLVKMGASGRGFLMPFDNWLASLATCSPLMIMPGVL